VAAELSGLLDKQAGSQLTAADLREAHTHATELLKAPKPGAVQLPPACQAAIENQGRQLLRRCVDRLESASVFSSDSA
jgi:hypothetical protein